LLWGGAAFIQTYSNLCIMCVYATWHAYLPLQQCNYTKEIQKSVKSVNAIITFVDFTVLLLYFFVFIDDIEASVNKKKIRKKNTYIYKFKSGNQELLLEVWIFGGNILELIVDYEFGLPIL